MSRIRIMCKAPPPPPPRESNGTCLINGTIAQWDDVSVTFVGDDGTEHSFDNVTGITWRCSQGVEATAILEVINVDIEAEAEVEA